MSDQKSNAWRVKDAAGVVRIAPTPQAGHRSLVSSRIWWHTGPGSLWAIASPRDAVANWATRNGVNWREIAEPGQLFSSEKVAEAVAKCRDVVDYEVEYRHNVASVALEKIDQMIAKGEL